MTSPSRPRRSVDDALDVLIRQTLRVCVAGARPPESGWEVLAARIEARGRQTQPRLAPVLGLWREALAWWLAALDYVLPLLELPVGNWSDPRTARNNVHWRCLYRHRVSVRLLG
jgi:hypothetical protein